MRFRQGNRQEVWQAVKQAGMADDIAKIAAVFDVTDIAVINAGECVYLNEKPRKTTRIAVATRAGKEGIKTEIAKSKHNPKRLKGL